jgi:hypothetical protein
LGRKKGIQESHIDFLIYAVANRIEAQIFTNDNDFTNYQKVIQLGMLIQISKMDVLKEKIK